tara:strand:- start:1842 stop:1949 length:108 start_codon:yes stop_codon:yes gene_type:complete
MNGLIKLTYRQIFASGLSWLQPLQQYLLIKKVLER